MSESEDPRTAAICEFFSQVFLSVTTKPEDLSDLSDGVIMYDALSEM